MGQQSSQLVGENIEGGYDVQTTRLPDSPADGGERKRGREEPVRKKRRRDVRPSGNSKEEESARTLLEIKAAHGRKPPLSSVKETEKSRDPVQASVRSSTNPVRPPTSSSTDKSITSKSKPSRQQNLLKKRTGSNSTNKTTHTAEQRVNKMLKAPSNRQSLLSETNGCNTSDPNLPSPFDGLQGSPSHTDGHRPSNDDALEIHSADNNHATSDMREISSNSAETVCGESQTEQPKKQKPSQPVVDESSASALAEAASAANDLIDPGQAAQQGVEWGFTAAEVASLTQAFDDVIDIVENGAESRQAPTSKKRKRKHQPPDVEEATVQPEQVEVTPEEQRAPTKKFSRTRARPSEVLEDLTRAEYTEAELRRLDKYFDRYRGDHDWTWEQMNARIQRSAKGGKTDAFWLAVGAVLPHRPIGSVLKLCRRRFHNYGKRGTWTEEDDETLKANFALYGRSWKKIGDTMERMAEDVRDRYRNYIVCGDARNSGEWTAEEEALLIQSINECVNVMRQKEAESQGLPPPPPDAPFTVEEERKWVVWPVVAEKMGQVRSRLQCQYKWRKMNAAARKVGGGPEPSQESQAAPKPPNWRDKKAQQHVAKWLPGDYYRLLKGLETTFNSSLSDKIPWKTLGPPEWRAHTAVGDRRTAWNNVRATVPEANYLSDKEIVRRLLADLQHEHPTQLDECFMDYADPTSEIPPEEDFDNETRGLSVAEEFPTPTTMAQQPRTPVHKPRTAQQKERRRQREQAKRRRHGNIQDDSALDPGLDVSFPPVSVSSE
ncbi:MAG: RNA polymerase I enhancer binding protein [Caeruleum heppii]|nr:MAG: RNA polymerase I enhancer binding protein [Caeruleum heppii]